MENLNELVLRGQFADFQKKWDQNNSASLQKCLELLLDIRGDIRDEVKRKRVDSMIYELRNCLQTEITTVKIKPMKKAGEAIRNSKKAGSDR